MTLKTLKSTVAIAGVAITAIAAESCSKHSDIPIEFETRTDSIGYMMPYIDNDTVFSAAKYSVVWPERIGRDDLGSLRDSLLAYTFGKPDTKNFREASKQFMLEGVYSMREEADSAFTHIKVPYDTAYNADNKNFAYVVSEVTLLTPNILVIRIDNYQYSYGSAHGMQAEHYMNYSIADAKLLNAGNIFKPGNEQAIFDLINTQAKVAYPEEGTLFAEPIRSLGTVQLEADNIVFVYQPYDVAPYSTGIVRIPVSRYDLQRFLTAEALRALSQDE